MALCAFLGDELSTFGFRLAGVECHRPAPQETLALFRSLREQVQLILITAEVAAALPPELLRRSQRDEHPLVLVIPDIRRHVVPPDRVAAVRRQLGMAE